MQSGCKTGLMYVDVGTPFLIGESGIVLMLRIHQTYWRKGTTMQTVTKRDLVERIADITSTKRADVKAIVQSFMDEIIRELSEGNRLEFRDFGVFESLERAARTAQNPKTLEPVRIPRRRTARFKAGRMMKIKLQKGMQPGDVQSSGESARP